MKVEMWTETKFLSEISENLFVTLCAIQYSLDLWSYVPYVCMYVCMYACLSVSMSCLLYRAVCVFDTAIKTWLTNVHNTYTYKGLSVAWHKSLQAHLNIVRGKGICSTTSCSASRYDQIMPLLHRLHWLRAPQRISAKLAVLAFRCLRGLAPTYLSDSLRHVADLPGRQRLRSACVISGSCCATDTSSYSRWSSVLCCGSRTWNSLPSEVTSSVTLSTFKQKLKTYLFSLSFPGT